MIIHHVDDLPSVRDALVVWKRKSGGLQALSLGGFQSRHDAVLDLLDQADREHAVPEFGPVLVHTLDRPVSTVEQPWRSYAFCTADGYLDVPVPDFVFGGWPEVGIDDFDETCWSVQSAGEQPAQRPVIGWIGSTRTHPVREVLLQLGRQHPDVLDVSEVDWVPGPAARRLQSAGGNSLTLDEQTRRWSALLDVEGKGYSGRLKLLLHSGRPVLLQDRPWREWFWDSLVPMEHFVPVRGDLSDLVAQARWVQQHPQEAAHIGRAAQKLAQELHAQVCRPAVVPRPDRRRWPARGRLGAGGAAGGTAARPAALGRQRLSRRSRRWREVPASAGGRCPHGTWSIDSARACGARRRRAGRVERRRTDPCRRGR